MLIYRIGPTLGDSPVVAAGMQQQDCQICLPCFSLLNMQFIVTENSCAEETVNETLSFDLYQTLFNEIFYKMVKSACADQPLQTN